MKVNPYFDEERELFYQELLRSRVLALCAEVPWGIYLFGSRAKGQARRGSDFEKSLSVSFSSLDSELVDLLQQVCLSKISHPDRYVSAFFFLKYSRGWSNLISLLPGQSIL